MPHDQMFPKWKHLIYRYGITRSPSCGSFCCLVIPLLRTRGKDEAMKGIPKTPVEFDYDLWTTEDGKCMVRIKATGEVTEVERTVMQVLRSEEKRFRRAMSLDQEADRDGISKPTILSLDVLPEDVTDSNWLADTVDYTEEISTKLLEQRLRESLTPTQYGIYQACILNGISYKAYADQMGVSYQSVQNAIRLIQKKAKNIFG